MKEKLLYIFIFCLFAGKSFAQIGMTVETPVNMETVVQNLAGKGIEISNVSYQCDSRAFGSFSDILGQIGLSEGLLLTTGTAEEVATSNNQESAGLSLFGSDQPFFDPDLQQSLNQSGTSGDIFDMCRVEFDIKPTEENLSFRYVFGSEEYPEYINSFFDVFGFYIEGEFIEGLGTETRNLAVVPNTNQIVSVGSINQNNNSQYYISNNQLSALPGGLRFEYDGYTIPLTATTQVIPCETYRMKLIIADFQDAIYDSGVLIEAGSLVSTSTALAEVEYETEDFDYLIEACHNAEIVFFRPDYSDINSSFAINYELNETSTATEVEDFPRLLPSPIIIPAGDSVFRMKLFSFEDGIEEDEIIKIDLLHSCLDKSTFSLEIPLKDEFPYEIPPESICKGDSVQLNVEDQTGKYALTWENTSFLSCLDCVSPWAKNLQTDTFSTNVRHIESGCRVDRETAVDVLDVIADFEYEQSEDYTTLDFQFNNLSNDATNYIWNFGDGTINTKDVNPFHTYPFENTSQEALKYDVKLVAQSTNPFCTDTIIKSLEIEEPLFIPNIVTPNGDDKNESFWIDGIIYYKWEFKVYNRWGKEVYFSEGYHNEWTAENVEDGVYYYELTNPKKDRIYNGWIEVLR
ncbi:MAG: hypothetical protein GY827_09430 [Cytophagales bacterium]|nr:hypothetical protein [Cytophagales bacterium]